METKKKDLKQFFVLEYCWNGKLRQWDVLPWFRYEWDDKEWGFDKDQVKTKEDLLKWVERVARYYFWAKCEHEFIMMPWPYKDSPREGEDKSPVRVLQDQMIKIDVFTQLKPNFPLITDILAEEFGITE